MSKRVEYIKSIIESIGYLFDSNVNMEYNSKLLYDFYVKSELKHFEEYLYEYPQNELPLYFKVVYSFLGPVYSKSDNELLNIKNLLGKYSSESRYDYFLKDISSVIMLFSESLKLKYDHNDMLYFYYNKNDELCTEPLFVLNKNEVHSISEEYNVFPMRRHEYSCIKNT